MSDDRILMQTADIVPVTSYEAEFARWREVARNPDAPNPQRPIDELFGEHHLMDVALAAMERETRRLSVHHDLRPAVWEQIVDFLGNFVYQVHRRKEEQGLFPVWKDVVGPTEAEAIVKHVEHDHEQATRMTLDLLNGVNTGDWEKVLRAAHLYLRVVRDHLVQEEHEIFEPMRAALSPEQVQQVREKFDALERFGLGERDRKYYLELTRSMCQQVGLGDLLPE